MGSGLLRAGVSDRGEAKRRSHRPHPSEGVVAVTWSSDAKPIAFAANGNRQNSGSVLCVVNAGSTGLSVVPSTGTVWGPAWRAE